jgi:hypothetical protein
VSKGCADVQFFFDQAFTCAIKNIDKCGGTSGGGGGLFGCIRKVCEAEIAACIGATCPT